MATGEHANDSNDNFRLFISDLQNKSLWSSGPVSLFPPRIKTLIYKLVIILSEQLVILQNKPPSIEKNNEDSISEYSAEILEIFDLLKHSNEKEAMKEIRDKKIMNFERLTQTEKLNEKSLT